jgi:MSHA biogenesis protein MshP
MRRPRHASGGFATIVALFLLVVLAALGAFMVSISTSQQVGSAQDIQGTRAYWAARAGLEWGIGSLTASPASAPHRPHRSRSKVSRCR